MTSTMHLKHVLPVLLLAGLILVLAPAPLDVTFRYGEPTPEITQKAWELGNKGLDFFKKSQLDSAIKYFHEANQLINQHGIKEVALVHLVKNQYGISLAFLQQNPKSLEIFKELNQFYRSVNSDGAYHIDLAKTYNNIAINYNFMYQYEQALRYFDSCLVFFRKADLMFDEDAQVTYLNKALNYLDIGNYQAAVEHVDMSRYIRTHNPKLNDDAYNIMQEYIIYAEVLVEVSQNITELQEAIQYSRKALEIALKDNPDDYYISSIYGHISMAYFKLGEYANSVEYMHKTIQFLTDHFGPEYPGLITRYGFIGKVFAAMESYDSATFYYNKAMSVPLERDESKAVHKADVLLKIAQVQLTQGDFSQLNAHLAACNRLLFPGMENPEEIMALPPGNLIPGNTYIGQYFRDKGELLYRIYQSGQPDEYLKSAVDNYFLGIEVGMKQRKGMQSIRAKGVFAAQMSNQMEQAFAMAFQLYEKVPSLENFQKIRWLTAQSKGVTLKEMVQSKTGLAFGIPQEIRARELDLKSNLNYLEQLVFQESFTQTLRATPVSEEGKKALMSAKVAFDEFLEELRLQYPQYYQVMYESSGSGQSFARGLPLNPIDPHTLVVDYFEGTDAYYVQFNLGKHYGVYTVAKEAVLTNALQTLKNSLSTKQQTPFQEEAYWVYQKLLAPALRAGNPRKLIVVPDGALAYIPFDLLVDELIDQPGNFHQYRYLLHRFPISYQYTLPLVKTQPPRPRHQRNLHVLALAPDFEPLKGQLLASADEQLRSGLAPLAALPFAQAEVEKLSTLFEGTFLYGPQATETQVREGAGKADLIHLATHSVINDRNPMMSQLILAPDQENDGLLHTYELFDIDLKADLVCLSACNSGLGELQQGEGMVSLARGFMYAKVPHLMMSLWAVPDRSTSELMLNFYSALQEGVPYEEAMRQAKLKYLQQADQNLGHPYYWGAFIHVGAPEESTSGNWIYVPALALLGLGFVLFAAYRIRRKPR
jgi:CHAT domain-containing protein